MAIFAEIFKEVLKEHNINKVTSAGLLVALGIIFGDIGTSPLYVLKAIVGTNVIDSQVVIGGVSCIFWTLTLQTTIKYVLITLRADNNGEGGIFSLYALIRKNKRRLYIAAVIGGSTLLADGIITPSISVSSAIEGLRIFNPNVPTIPIVITILTLLFLFQQFGTNLVGKAFGPIMFVWFIMLAVLGLAHISDHWIILKAVNPWYGIRLLLYHPGGFWLLGAVFLCTTGAEALYSDLGHCGRKNIQVSWIFVKLALILNYFGQGAWLIGREGQTLGSVNPFYALMPKWFLIPGIAISTVAVIVASQALISGSYTLINEAIRLNFWPRVRIKHPTVLRGQIYIPSINWMLWLGCIFIVIHFRESSNMEAAYGLSIIITMLMTSLLLFFYLKMQKTKTWLLVLFILLYGSVEGAFLVANLNKFAHGGWITPLMASVLVCIMFIWYSARRIRNKYLDFSTLSDYTEMLQELSEDKEVPKFATHLIYITSADKPTDIESKIIYSIFQKQPKRADIYWFVHVDVQDEPYKMEYKVSELLSGKVIRIDIKIGFRIPPRINLIFRMVVEELVANGEVDITSRYRSLKEKKVIGDFRFVVLERFLPFNSDIPLFEAVIMNIYYSLRRFTLSEAKAYGLDHSLVRVEKVPLVINPSYNINLKRVY